MTQDDAPPKPPTPPFARMRDIRRLAMQTLYLIDATGQTDAEDLIEALEEPMDEGEPAVPNEPKIPAVELALSAWARKQDADEQLNKFTEDWPTHRQAPVDRAILRLAWFEMASRRNDNAVIINEALELAKQFSNEQAPAFINGVLDRLAKRYPQDKDGKPDTPAPFTGDGWLDDAIKPT